MANRLPAPDVVALTKIDYEANERDWAMRQADAEKKLADDELQGEKDQSLDLAEAKRRKAERQQERERLAKQRAAHQQQVQIFNAQMEDIRVQQQQLFHERDKLRDRGQQLEDELRRACGIFQHYQAMSEPFYNMNPGQWPAVPFPQVGLGGQINYVSPVIRKSEAGPGYGYINAGRAQATSEVISIQQQLAAVWQEWNNLKARANELKQQCDQLEKNRPVGALVRPLPPQ
jgi:chromosome segregation ATPase